MAFGVVAEAARRSDHSPIPRHRSQITAATTQPSSGRSGDQEQRQREREQEEIEVLEDKHERTRQS
jgi:hypothetical protein